MNIGIDARIIFRRGVGRYISSLVASLLEIDHENTYHVYLDRNSVLNDYYEQKNCIFRRLDTTNALLYEQNLLPRAAEEDGVDVLHGTDNTVPYLLPAYKGKKVVTIHDTMFIRPIAKAITKPSIKQRLTDIYNKAAIPASARSADMVITVSDYSRQDIMKYINIPGEKIAVIKEGVADKYRVIRNNQLIEKARQKYSLTKPYILASAAADLRKNTQRVLEAFNIFNNMTEYRYQLVLTSIGGAELASTNIPDIIKRYNMEKYVVLTGYVPDDDMVLLYNGALFFLFPSIWEGFGLQVLEAFSCGLPVITSDNTSLREVAGDAALFVDPFSVEDIVRGMEEMEKSENKMQALTAKGFVQAAKFSWKETAKSTLRVYEAVVSGKNEK
ncbi:MAG TPA: glycosyltransferase family 1 protein [Candidatus Goldiibacteriota bacterium]|nr:glycosyltransferase family 1 protein [Candidatus Goldiibacteriota bacterium]